MDTSDTAVTTSSRARGRRGAATPAAASDAPSVVVLGPRDSLVGTLTVDGDVRIEGTLDGEVTATGEVSVHSTGTARAQISARDIVVSGSVEGNATARELLALADTGSFAGEIRTGRLRVDEGATLNATITMTPGGDAPPARRTGAHDEEASVDVTGSPVSAESDPATYGEEQGSESDADGERAAETSGISSGADSEEG